MIRDPSDGSVREKGDVISTGFSPTSAQNEREYKALLATSTSGLPISKAKAEYLARLELSREWLQNYHQRSASTST